MGSAFAAAALVLFHDNNLSTGGVFAPSGGGTPLAVRVMRSSASDRVAGGTSTYGATGEADTAEILTSEVPQKPGRGSIITYDGRTRAVEGAVSTKNGQSWTLTLASV